MMYVLAVLVGAVWGFLGALVNLFIMKQALKKDSTGGIVASNFLRTVVDAGFLAVVFLLRDLLPFNYMLALVGTAAGLSLATIYFSFRLVGQQRKGE